MLYNWGSSCCYIFLQQIGFHGFVQGLGNFNVLLPVPFHKEILLLGLGLKAVFSVILQTLLSAGLSVCFHDVLRGNFVDGLSLSFCSYEEDRSQHTDEQRNHVEQERAGITEVKADDPTGDDRGQSTA